MPINRRALRAPHDLHPDDDLFSTTDIGNDRPPLGKPVDRQRSELPD